jgi:hypothetical protein
VRLVYGSAAEGSARWLGGRLRFGLILREFIYRWALEWRLGSRGRAAVVRSGLYIDWDDEAAWRIETS